MLSEEISEAELEEAIADGQENRCYRAFWPDNHAIQASFSGNTGNFHNYHQPAIFYQGRVQLSVDKREQTRLLLLGTITLSACLRCYTRCLLEF
jgi:hypothetical protein